MNNTLDTAVARMQAQGYRPFSPDHATCPTRRWIRDSDMPLEVAQTAERMDALIGALSVGILIGWAIKGVIA